MRSVHLEIMIDDFLLIPNIAPSSSTFLHNNLSWQIYDTSADISQCPAMGYDYLHTSLNKFLHTHFLDIFT